MPISDCANRYWNANFMICGTMPSQPSAPGAWHSEWIWKSSKPIFSIW